ncbi:MAG TPA: glutamate synthase subunit beta [Armatimonadota bacterium]|jgi:glutamate synthase (NADPH/NADH) small chain
MAKPTGFLEFNRELPIYRSPAERVKDWNEFTSHHSDEILQEQGARCMDCGTPFCHTGAMLKGMATGCPIRNIIPEWNDLVYRGLWQQALERLERTNNFPEFTGRVCPAPCEAGCVLGINNPPVTIKNIEATLADRGWEKGWITPAPPAHRTGKKVAVVGSGPAGLSCAAQLNKVGHLVTVYERADRIGGLLMYGIPNMKLDKSVVQRRVDLLAEEGVTFITGTEVGKDISAKQLTDEFDAVVLCGGATKARDLPTEGRELGGIHLAVDFLRANTQRVLNGEPPADYTSAEGKDVIVIGGGDTGTDCVGTSLRQGCRSVTQFEILPQPPSERAPNNPWPEWPKVLTTDYGQEEAAALFGHDPRVFCIQTERFVGDKSGSVSELHTVQVEWQKDETDRFSPRPIAGSERVWPAQLVLLAMGFLGPEGAALDELGIDRDARSNAKAEHDCFATNVPGVFAAGDMRRGQSLVVWAINEGRGAARECDRYLMGTTELP